MKEWVVEYNKINTNEAVTAEMWFDEDPVTPAMALEFAKSVGWPFDRVISIRLKNPNAKSSKVAIVTNPLEHALHLIDEEKYEEAQDILKQAAEGDYDALFCLANIGWCKFCIAAYEKTGTGMLSAFSRRQYLLSAREYYEGALNFDSNHVGALEGICKVEYALGLLMHTKDGRTSNFIDHYNKLKKLDLNAAKCIDRDTKLSEKLFSSDANDKVSKTSIDTSTDYRNSPKKIPSESKAAVSTPIKRKQNRHYQEAKTEETGCGTWMILFFAALILVMGIGFSIGISSK